VNSDLTAGIRHRYVVDDADQAVRLNSGALVLYIIFYAPAPSIRLRKRNHQPEEHHVPTFFAAASRPAWRKMHPFEVTEMDKKGRGNELFIGATEWQNVFKTMQKERSVAMPCRLGLTRFGISP